MRPRPRLGRLARPAWVRVLVVLAGLLLTGVLVTPAYAQSPLPPPPPPGGVPSLPTLPGTDPTGWLIKPFHELINSWFRNMIANALNPVLELLGRTLLATPDLTVQGGRVENLWWTTLGLANSLYALIIMIGGVMVMSRQTLQTRYALKDIAPRLLLGVAASNLSLLLTGWAIELANGLSAAFIDPGIDPGWVNRVLWQLVIEPMSPGLVFVVLLAGVVLLLAIGLILTYLVRVSLTVLLIVAAPLALACHALPQTEGIARLWWRSFTACLLIQVGQALVLITALQVFLTPDLSTSVFGLPEMDFVGMLVTVCLLWVLFRIPFWAFKTVYSPRTNAVVRLIRTVIISRALGALPLRRP